MRTRTTLVPLVTLQRRHRRRLPINHGPLATRTWRRKSCGLELRTVRTVDLASGVDLVLRHVLWRALSLF